MEKMKQFLMATDSYDIRRYLAILFSAAGCAVLTVMLGWIVFLLAANAAYLFWIAIGLLVLIGLMQTGFVSLLVKRAIVLNKDSIELKDFRD